MNQQLPSLRQEALRLGFAFSALLIVGLMTTVATETSVQVVVTEKAQKKGHAQRGIAAGANPKPLIAPEKSSSVAAASTR